MMRDPVAEMKKQPGYQEYQEQAARTPPSSYPWGFVLANMGGIAAAHALGYYAGVPVADALARSRFGARFARLHPDVQRRAITQAVGALGSVATVSAGLAHMAGQVRIAEEVSRLEKERKAAGSEKVASIYDVYHQALLELSRE